MSMALICSLHLAALLSLATNLPATWGALATFPFILVGMIRLIPSSGTGHWQTVACASGVAVAMLLSVGISRVLIDTSYDGAAYHQVGIIALARGWNPLYDPAITAWWPDNYPLQAWLAPTIADGGLWVDHYPRGAWVMQALIAQFFPPDRAANWLNPFLTLVSCIALWHGLVACHLSRYLALLLAIAAALSPVVVVQIPTNMVDGALGSALLIESGAALAWLQQRRPRDFATVLLAALLSIDLKFTGLVYSTIICGGTIAMGYWRYRRPNLPESRALSFAVAAVALIGVQTYLPNTLNHGYPFYPINTVDIISPNLPSELLPQNRIVKLAFSLGVPPQQTTVTMEQPLPSPTFLLPRLWHYSVIARHADMRMNGFGTLFAWSLFLALLIFGAAVIRLLRGTHLTAGGVTLLGFSAILVVTIAINPESWWARYVPQFWLIPVFAASLAILQRWYAVAGVLTALIVVGTTATVTFNLLTQTTLQADLHRRAAEISARHEIVLAPGFSSDHGVFAFTVIENARGNNVRFADPGVPCDDPVTLFPVRTCR